MAISFPKQKADELAKLIDGEVHCDNINQMLYATDASIYQQQPLAVVKPKHRNDCIKIIQFANEHEYPVIPRAAGTSLAGQVVGRAIIIDTSRHMNNIVEINVEERTARTQPGVVLSILNQQAKQFGLQFAPDPSTASRCTISGMIGNNAWGAHCPQFGTTRDHVIALNTILSDGSNVQFHPVKNDAIEKIISQSTAAAHIYKFLYDIIDEHRNIILKSFPALNEIPCNAGYPLHVLAQSKPWQIDGPAFNIAKFLCGTEGTLALVTEATVNLVSIPKHRHMVCCHFESLNNALQAVRIAVSFKASAVELLDHFILSFTKTNLEQQRNRHWINGEPQAVLLVEFCGDNAQELKDKASNFIDSLSNSGLSYHHTQLINDQAEAAWAIRRAGLGLLMGMQSSRKPVTFVEDSAVPVNVLPEFVSEFNKVLKEHNTECVFYGSVSMGLIHLRPILDLKSDEERQKLIYIAHQTAELLETYGGTMSAKHGDGRVRSQFVRRMLGDEVHKLIKRTKKEFDPKNLFNPDKILNLPPINFNLRTDSLFVSKDPPTYLDWKETNGIIAAIERCNGAGVCRKPAGDGIMCPSYMVTLDEKHSTRGRANVIRQTIQKYGFDHGIAHENIREVLKLCLSCKGCRSECPANVDMARLKIEHMQHYIKNHGTPLRTHFIRNYETLSKMATYAPTMANTFLNSYFLKSLLGYHPSRRLPSLQKQTLSNWYKRHKPHSNSGKQGEVVILNSAFTEYYDVKVGIAAIEFLECTGYQVTLSPCFKSVRTVLSQGLVEVACRRLKQLIQFFRPYVKNNVPIIGLEPSELLTFRDEAPSLLDNASESGELETINRSLFLFEEFISNERYKIESQNLDWKNTRTTMLLHGHCHQKALIGLDTCVDALSLIPESGVQTIPSGCCGMAGSFGYEYEHYDLSLRIGKLILFPTIRNASKDTAIVATGTSCRHQIKEHTNIDALHPAEVLRKALVF